MKIISMKVASFSRGKWCSTISWEHDKNIGCCWISPSPSGFCWCPIWNAKCASNAKTHCESGGHWKNVCDQRHEKFSCLKEGMEMTTHFGFIKCEKLAVTPSPLRALRDSLLCQKKAKKLWNAKSVWKQSRPARAGIQSGHSICHKKNSWAML